jgi:hypothetical protein
MNIFAKWIYKNERVNENRIASQKLSLLMHLFECIWAKDSN